DRTAVLRMGGTNLHSWPDAAFERTLSPAGMSAYGIAAELNRRKVSAEVNGIPWRAQRNIPVGPGRYILTAVNARAATLGRSLGRQLICALDFVLYRFREAQPHPREPEPTHPLSTSLPRRRRAIPAYLLATSFTASMWRTALARSSSSRQQWMPGVITSRAVARRASKPSCANPLQTMSRSVTMPISRSFSPIGMEPMSCSHINFASSVTGMSG